MLEQVEKSEGQAGAGDHGGCRSDRPDGYGSQLMGETQFGGMGRGS